MHLLTRLVVTLAVIATLIFNAAYGYGRGASEIEKASLVLVAIIIDLGKSTFLAAAALLVRSGLHLRAVVLVILWCPCFALSTWAGYAFIASTRAETAASKSAGYDNRRRAEMRVEDARRQRDRITSGAAFTATAGCSQTRTPAARSACAAYDAAVRELDSASRALAAMPIGAAAAPESRLLATITGLSIDTVELLIAFVPALLLELIASVGVYAVTRPTAAARPAAATAEVLRPTPSPSPAPVSKPTPAPAEASPTAAAEPKRRTLTVKAAPTGGALRS